MVIKENKDRLDIYDWFIQEYEDDDCSREFAEHFINKSLIASKGIHNGDCTYMPQACILCQIQEILEGYYNYCINS